MNKMCPLTIPNCSLLIYICTQNLNKIYTKKKKKKKKKTIQVRERTPSADERTDGHSKVKNIIYRNKKKKKKKKKKRIIIDWCRYMPL